MRVALPVFRVLFTGLLTFLLFYYSTSTEKYWLVLTALLWSQVQLRFMVWINVLLILLAHISLIYCLMPFPWLLTGYLFFFTIIVLYFGKTQALSMSFVLTIVLGLIAAALPTELILQRQENLVLGMIVAFVMGIVFKPSLQMQYKNCLSALDELQKKIFSVYLQRKYLENYVFYERIIHQQQENVFDVLTQLEIRIKQLSSSQKKFWIKRLDYLNHLFEMITTLGELRYRVEDPATFEVCEKEFLELSRQVSMCLNQKTYQLSTFNLEELYRTTLQVVSKEPLIFLIFIHHLQALGETLKLLHDEDSFERKSWISSKLSCQHAPPPTSTSRGLSAGSRSRTLDPADKPRDVEVGGGDRSLSGIRVIRLERLISPVRQALAVLIGILLSFQWAHAEKYWLPISALLVMQTSVGLMVRQGVERCITMLLGVLLAALVAVQISSIPIIAAVVIFVFSFACYLSLKYSFKAVFSLPFLFALIFLISMMIPSYSTVHARLFDVMVGSIIGIIINVLFLPAKPDEEFRVALLPVVKRYQAYLQAIFALLLKEPNALEKVEYEQKVTMMSLQSRHAKFPLWIFQPGLALPLRQGHRHFLIMIERIAQILLSLQHLARHTYDQQLLEALRPALINYLTQTEVILQALSDVLNLNTLKEGVTDLSEETNELEKTFKKLVPHSIELIDISRDYIYLAAFIEDLKDLQKTLLRLGQALR